MKKNGTAILLLCALIAVFFSFFGDNSYKHLQSLKENLALQHSRNAALTEEVAGLRKQANGLRSDKRVLEKAARNELGMARPNELIFIFEKHTAASD